jgi:hypothetical protein
MKVIGMGLIIFGHTGGTSLVSLSTAPINSKQLGVAFFVFISGYTLATETRRPLHVVFHRFFPVALFTLLTALVISVIQWFRIGDINESNYLPLLAGANVLVNAFPANPTTWYVGTYFHLLVAWAVVVRRVNVTGKIILAVAAAEIAIRAVLLSIHLDYVAYMMISNWMVVFVMGQYFGVGLDDAGRETWAQQRSSALPLVSAAALCLFLAFWTVVSPLAGITSANPFGRIPAALETGSFLLTSAAVTLQYAIYVITFFGLANRIPQMGLSRFLAANTLIVFLAHMPLIYAVSPTLYHFVPQGWLRVVCNIGVHFLALAALSSLLQWAMRPIILRARPWNWFPPHKPMELRTKPPSAR